VAGALWFRQKVFDLVMRSLRLILCTLALLAFGPGGANALTAAHASPTEALIGATSISTADTDDDVGSHNPCKPRADQADHAKCLAGFNMSALPLSLHTVNPADEGIDHCAPFASMVRGRVIAPPFHPPKLPAA
jgi:hypothetical protein